MSQNSAASGFYRREMFVDARDIQSEDAETGEIIPEEEYEQLLITRGREKLADYQLVQSFETTVRTRDTTYEFGTDFFLGDTITVIDERLGVTVDAVVESVQFSVSKSGESMSLTFGYGQPTVYDKLKRKADV